MATIRKTAEFAKWERQIKDKKAQAIIEARIERVAFGLLGDVRSVGEGVSELRIHYGPGYRVYFTRKGGELIILLCGGDKGSQQRDIKKAARLVKELEG
jgi:putative addiction module killer protein